MVVSESRRRWKRGTDFPVKNSSEQPAERPSGSVDPAARGALQPPRYKPERAVPAEQAGHAPATAVAPRSACFESPSSSGSISGNEGLFAVF